MQNLEDLQDFAQHYQITYPSLLDQIQDIYDLAEYEIEQGGSPRHECSLAEQDIEQLIEDYLEQQLDNFKKHQQ